MNLQSLTRELNNVENEIFYDLETIQFQIPATNSGNIYF
jgi:hypothetical protein